MYLPLLQANATMYTNNTALIMGVVLLGLLGFSYYRLQKSNPGLDFGPLVSTQMVMKHESIFMGIIFLEYLFAALIATTVHKPAGDMSVEMSPLGRFGMHIIIAATGTVAQFTLARDVAIQATKLPFGERFGQIIILFIIAVVAFGVPYANLMLIASAGGEALQFDIWLWSITPFVGTEELQSKLIELGLPPNYRAWQNMSGALQVCIVTSLLAHYALAVVEGLRTITSPHRRKMLMDRIKAESTLDEKKEGDKDKDKSKDKDPRKPMEGEERIKNDLTSNVVFLLKRARYTDEKTIKNLADSAQKIVLNMGKSEQEKTEAALAMSQALASLVLRAKTIDTAGGSTKPQDNAKLIEDIRQLFGRPAKDSNGNLLPMSQRGLGMTLKNFTPQ